MISFCSSRMPVILSMTLMYRLSVDEHFIEWYQTISSYYYKSLLGG